MGNIDMTQTVSKDTINYLGVVGIIIISAIIILTIIFLKRHKARVIPLFVGILGYIVFILIGYNIIISLILTIPGVQSNYDNNPQIFTVIFLVVFVAIYMAARIIIGNALYNHYNQPGDVLMFGLGIGLCDALLYAFSSLTLIVWAIGINTSGMTELFKDFSEADMISTYNSISLLFTAPSILWVLLGISAVFDILLNCGLAVLTFGVVSKKIPTWWYLICAFINFIVLLPFKFYESTSITGVLIPFAIKTIFFLAAMYLIYKTDEKSIGGIIGYRTKNDNNKKVFKLPRVGRFNNK